MHKNINFKEADKYFNEFNYRKALQIYKNLTIYYPELDGLLLHNIELTYSKITNNIYKEI